MIKFDLLRTVSVTKNDSLLQLGPNVPVILTMQACVLQVSYCRKDCFPAMAPGVPDTSGDVPEFTRHLLLVS